jgi:acetyl-CoA carboxylase biotin carboxyl carrier protein
MTAIGEQGDTSELAAQVHHLVSELRGPLRRVIVQQGDTRIEIEWAASARDRDGVLTRPEQAIPDTSGPVTDPGLNGHTQILAPIVGTFYHGPEPGAPPFVQPGEHVRPGMIVGIVEAMKLMHEVAADRAGVVAAVLVGNGEPVEYAQPLMALTADGGSG